MGLLAAFKFKVKVVRCRHTGLKSQFAWQRKA